MLPAARAPHEADGGVTEDGSVDNGSVDNGDEPTQVLPEPTPRRRFVPNPIAYEAPPPRRIDPGRWLRNLAGVDDNLLRAVWFERARHTALGGIILGTALIAGFSMWTAINEAIGYATWVTFIPALIWFIFIISVDRALVSTMYGSGAAFRQGRRWGAFLLRLLLSVMFGFIIAEPLTIRIFQTAIEQHIRDERVQQLDDLRTNLLRCNPSESFNIGAAPPSGCEGFRLSFEATPAALQTELSAKQKDETTLAATVAADDKELARLTKLARDECAGVKGPGLTGDKGYGPDCRDRNADVATFKATHPMKANNDRLTALRADITALSEQIKSSQANFESTRDKLIDARVQEAKDHQGAIGLLERMRALHDLAASSWALFLSTWAVRLFFILADCLPVVVKFSSGSSEYDKIVRAQAANAVRRYDQDLQMLDTEAQTAVRKHRADLDLEVQEHRADVAIRRGDAVTRVEKHTSQRPEPA